MTSENNKNLINFKNKENIQEINNSRKNSLTNINSTQGKT